jgi:hypothetical protein
MDSLIRAAKAVLTPLRFSYESGHFLSALQGKSVDARGRPIPMLTYPALATLDLIDLPKTKVLEWGTGQSSLFFSPRVSELVGVEQSQEWSEYVSRRTGSNVSLHVCHGKKELKAIEETLATQRFDIVLIDGEPYAGGSRMEAAEITLRFEHTPKLVIVDNTELKECDAIVDAFQQAGFLRIDFVGYSPGAFYKQCTSFFTMPEHAAWGLGNDSPVLVRSPRD